MGWSGNEPVTEPRRTFGPVVVSGIVGAGLAAWAGGKPWAAPDTSAASTLVDRTGGHVPLASALGLVALAGWGVVLVTRGRVRRMVAVLVAAASAGLVVTAFVGRSSALDSARKATVDLGEAVHGSHITGWWWLAVLASLLGLAAAVAAVVWCPSWPEMGRRYDTPVAPPAPVDPADLDDVDLWRAIDQGRDPTDPDAH
jgi:uncharacterized membrane protein (TIGR02234 family)